MASPLGSGVPHVFDGPCALIMGTFISSLCHSLRFLGLTEVIGGGNKTTGASKKNEQADLISLSLNYDTKTWEIASRKSTS